MDDSLSAALALALIAQEELVKAESAVENWQGNLQFALGELSDDERSLYDAMQLAKKEKADKEEAHYRERHAQELKGFYNSLHGGKDFRSGVYAAAEHLEKKGDVTW